MDDQDLSQQLTGQRPQSSMEEAWHKEQERRKYDIIRVKNPTNQDFYVKYDINQFQKVPANSSIDIPRYIAVRYINHMKDQIIHSIGQKKHDEALQERAAKGFPAFKDKAAENDETYLRSDYPRGNDQAVITPIINELWEGLVYEFGKDIPPSNFDPRSGEVDLTPIETRILDSLAKKRVDPSSQIAEVIRQDLGTPNVMAQPSTNQTPQPEFTPPTMDFTQLNDVLDKKLTPEEITSGG